MTLSIQSWRQILTPLKSALPLIAPWRICLRNNWAARLLTQDQFICTQVAAEVDNNTLSIYLGLELSLLINFICFCNINTIVNRGKLVIARLANTAHPVLSLNTKADITDAEVSRNLAAIEKRQSTFEWSNSVSSCWQSWSWIECNKTRLSQLKKTNNNNNDSRTSIQ